MYLRQIYIPDKIKGQTKNMKYFYNNSKLVRSLVFSLETLKIYSGFITKHTPVIVIKSNIISLIPNFSFKAMAPKINVNSGLIYCTVIKFDNL